MSTVGIIANPAAGKDIRRLVAYGRFVPNHEKVNILARVLEGLDSTGVGRVVMMPDSALMGRSASESAGVELCVELLEMPVFNEERDSTRAAELMAEMGVSCIITLGGDGTNRAVAKGCGNVPLVPVSTGTNNVFPSMVEGTLAGLAAGVVASGAVSPAKTITTRKRLEVYVDGKLRDIALVDVAVSKERFVGARAIWEMSTIHEIFLAVAEPSSIGLSALGAQLHPEPLSSDEGVYARLGDGGTVVTAPVAPGMIVPVAVELWRAIHSGDSSEVSLRPCTVALDGERSFSVQRDQKAHVTLSSNGPRVVSVEAALRDAALNGVFLSQHPSSDGRQDPVTPETPDTPETP